jgi:hypothetical protein
MTSCAGVVLVRTAVSLLVLSGCATVDPGTRFPGVQRVVEGRLGQRIVRGHVVVPAYHDRVEIE